MNGTSAATFEPDAPLTRAMLVTVLYRAAGEPAVSGTNPFTDVAAGAYYTDAVLWARQNGYICGYGDGRHDESDISAYATEAVNWAGAHGILDGMLEDCFGPNDNAACAEAAMMLMNYNRKTKTGSNTTQPEEKAPNILIACFSWAGHTEQIAKEIQAQTGGDLFVIQPETPYTDDINALSGIALQEQRDNVRPLLANRIEDIEQYDVVFVGYLCWWSDAPMPVFTFLEEYSFAEKTVIPFTSYGESVWGRSLDSIARSAKGSDIASGFAVQEHQMQDLQTRITEWLQGLDLVS